MVATTKAGAVVGTGLTSEVIIVKSENEHEKGHHEEASQLDDPSANHINKDNRKIIPWDRGAESN